MALRLGAENKTKVIAASVLGIVALILIVRMLFSVFGGSGDTPTASAPIDRPAIPADGMAGRSGGRMAQHLPSASQLDPTLHPEKMALAESTEYHGNGRNIFSKNSVPVEIPKPIASVRTGPPPPPPGPPPPPPIDLKFYGFASEHGGKPRIFLLQGDEVYIASEGDVVARRYHVGKIGPTSVVIQDIPVDNTQSIPLIQK